MKLKNCTRKKVVYKLKRQPSGWESIFSRYTSNKGLIARTYRELII
jgi:hypothetical protein